jgi:hypothetical protein
VKGYRRAEILLRRGVVIPVNRSRATRCSPSRTALSAASIATDGLKTSSPVFTGSFLVLSATQQRSDRLAEPSARTRRPSGARQVETAPGVGLTSRQACRAIQTGPTWRMSFVRRQTSGTASSAICYDTLEEQTHRGWVSMEVKIRKDALG